MQPRLMTGYVVLDLETTTTTYMKRKASPFTDDNWVVAAAYKGATTGVVGSYYGEDKQGFTGWLAALLEAQWPKLLVGFNIKFDILHSIKDPLSYATYKRWVAAGGQLFDCQLEEYLLMGQVPEAQMLSLDEVSPRYGGELKIDEVKALWKAGVNTHEIPRQLLMDYLVGRDGVGGDIRNTEAVFLGQLKAGTADKQIKSNQLNQGSLLCSIEMERNGLFVNSAEANVRAGKLREQSTSLTASLKTYLPKDLPFEFNWNSPVQKSALIFGGRIPYKEHRHQMDEAGAPAYAMKAVPHVLLSDGTSLTQEEYDSRALKGEHQHALRYSGGLKKGLVKTRNENVPDLSKPKFKWEDFAWPMKGFTKGRREWLGERPGVYSTKAEVIEELGGLGIPFLDAFADLASINKDLGTYYVTHEFDEEGEIIPGKSKGLLTLVQPDGIVHHKINHTSTITTRLSHSDPNAGNLPKAATSEVKKNFESRYGEEGVIVSSDFKTLEIYVQAMLTKDKALITDLRNGMDMHVKRLATVEDLPYDKVLLLAKGDQRKGIEAVPEWNDKRDGIKQFSFKRAYGAGAKSIAAAQKKPVELVQQWIDADEKMYPGIKLYNDKVEMVVNGSRVPTLRFATHPYLKVQVQLGRGWIRSFDGTKYVFTEQLSPEWLAKRGVAQGFNPPDMKNYETQGGGGQWMKAAMWLAVRAFFYYDNFGGRAHLINTVHDALYADSHKEVSRKVGIVIHACMLAASDLIEYQFGHKVPVPVPSDTGWGKSMFDEHHFEDADEFDASAQRVRTWIRKQFMAGYKPSYL